MRLSHPTATKFAALSISGVLRAWMSTLDFRVRMAPGTDPQTAGRPLLYAFWHEALLYPAFTHAKLGIAVLVSRHRDGELIAQVLRMLRGRTVRGSTTRGAVPALREMLRLAGASHLAITPDGPRGPRRVFQAGGVYIASRAEMPVVPVGFASACWRAPSWDRMMLPRPFSPARIVVGNPVVVPPDLTPDDLEDHRLRLEWQLRSVQTQAEELAQSGRADGTVPLVR